VREEQFIRPDLLGYVLTRNRKYVGRRERTAGRHLPAEGGNQRLILRQLQKGRMVLGKTRKTRRS